MRKRIITVALAAFTAGGIAAPVAATVAPAAPVAMHYWGGSDTFYHG